MFNICFSITPLILILTKMEEPDNKQDGSPEKIFSDICFYQFHDFRSPRD